MAATIKTRLAAVLGDPIGHSLSPRLHQYWFERYGVDGLYLPFGVTAETFEEAVRGLAVCGFRGFNVTLPHKERAFALVDERDAAAERMGAVNTVLIQEDGRLLGRNTDGLGFIANLEDEAPGWDPTSGPAVLLGAGGAARGIAYALIDAGVTALAVCNRNPDRAEALAGELSPLAAVTTVRWEGRSAALDGAGLLVNTTSLGMAGQPALGVDLAALPENAVVADIVYTPLITPLLTAAQGRGLATVRGLGMLLHQAVPGFTHWGGIEPAVDAETRAHVEAALV